MYITPFPLIEAEWRTYASINYTVIGSDNGLPPVTSKPLSETVKDYCQFRRATTIWYIFYILCIRYRRLDVEERGGGNDSSRHRAARISTVKDTEGILRTLGDRHDKQYPIYRDNEINGSSTLCTGMRHRLVYVFVCNKSFRLVSARLQYPQCVNNGDTAVLY